jgi:hypothetical protein
MFTNGKLGQMKNNVRLVMCDIQRLYMYNLRKEYCVLLLLLLLAAAVVLVVVVVVVVAI